MKKRFLSILATLCLCLTLLPATAMADDNLEQPPNTIRSWGALQTAINDNKDATLTSDIKWGGSSLTIPKGKNVTINLNAHSIDAENKGTVIKVSGTLTLENTGDIGLGGGPGSGPASGCLKNGTSDEEGGAGGIYIAPGGKLIMNGGWISNCTSTNSKKGAGGVYVSEGATFEMSAGVIRQCNGHPSNGLLATASGVVNRGTFTMTKCPILYSGNATSTNTSDTIVYNSGTFNANAYSSSPICSSAESNKSNVVNIMGTIISTKKDPFNDPGPCFKVPVINYNSSTISGGIYESTVSNSGTISGGTFKGNVNNCDNLGQLVGRISGGDFQNATVNGKYTVHVTTGKNMTVASGKTTQSDLLVQDMTPVVVTADNGYYFPDNYSVNEQNGVTVTHSASRVTVSGKPCFNVDITLPDATAKTPAATPSAVFTATGSDTGTLSNVDSGMQYSLDKGKTWTDINGTIATLTGLTSGTEIQIIKKGGETATDSAIQTITLSQAQTPTASFTATGTDSGTLNGVTSGMQYQIDNGAWKDIEENSVALNGLSKGTVICVRTKGTGATLFSQPQDIPLAQAEKPNATFTATDASTGTLSGVTTGMKYKIGDGGWNEISSNADISLNHLSACTISVMQSGGEELDSETQTIQVTKPTAPAATAQNCINGNDGKLTGVNNTMEYRSSGAGSWTAIDSDEVTGLAAGSYEVRYKASGTALASAPQTVTIGSYVAQLTKADNSVTYYDSLETAVNAAKNNSGSTVKLLQDIKVEAYSLGIEGCRNPFTIDLNGKTLSTDISDEIPGNLVFYLKNNDAPLTLINSASTQAVIKSQRAFHIQYSGSVIIGKPDGSDSNIKFELSTMLATSTADNTGSITIYGGTFECPVNVSTAENAGVSKVTLYGGTFSKIGVAAPATLVGTLAEGYGFRKENAWVNQLDGTELTGVTVQQAPIEAFALTADKTTANYGDAITLTTSVRLRDEEKAATYQWFKDGELVENTAESSYVIKDLTTGDHKITCTVSCDGYITSKSIDLKVNKANCQITPPAAKENLVYTGKEQALITAGTAIGGTMQYSLNGTDWQNTVPVGTNAGTYTVQYQVIGDSNHNNTKPALVNATIARQPVNVPEKDATVFTYDGEKKTYTIAENDNYMVANTEQMNAGTYTVTVTLKDTKNFVWNDKTDAAKEFPFVIAPAKVTVTIKDKSAYVGSKTAPDLSKPEKDRDYTISGLIGEDTLTGSVKLKYNPATPDMTKVSDTTQIVNNGSTLANSNYDVTYVDGKLTVTYRSSSGGSSGGGSSTTKTETTNNPDGSTTKTETKSDGTVVETTTNKDGSTTKTETKKDGSSVTENKDASGSTATVKTDKNGSTEAEAKISEKAVADAKESGEAVKVPAEVKAGENSSSAPTVKVELPKNAGETKVEIPVKNVSGGTVAVIVHPDGTEEIVKDSLPTENGIQLTVSGNTTVKIMDNSKDFVDVKDHWAKDAIDFVSARELVNGIDAAHYAPDAATTRAQLWTILGRQNDADLTGGANWYEKAQAWSVANGISDGTNPNGTITRAQMVTMLWRTAGSAAAESKTGFTDVSVDSYYAQAVAWAVENGITTGVGGGRFDPNATCTRAQIATFLARSLK